MNELREPGAKGTDKKGDEENVSTSTAVASEKKGEMKSETNIPKEVTFMREFLLKELNLKQNDTIDIIKGRKVCQALKFKNDLVS
jgi:hypothetical protein